MLGELCMVPLPSLLFATALCYTMSFLKPADWWRHFGDVMVGSATGVVHCCNDVPRALSMTCQLSAKELASCVDNVVMDFIARTIS